MTEKQQRILATALELFATEGYANTPTSRIAQRAGVSEGLIFRHFKNKEGLLEAVLEQGNATAARYVGEIVLSEDPKTVIRKTLELPFHIAEEEKPFWRLIYALKWQSGRYNKVSMEPLKAALIRAFSRLEYADPEAEANLLLVFFDGIATALLLHSDEDHQGILSLLKHKYHV